MYFLYSDTVESTYMKKHPFLITLVKIILVIVVSMVTLAGTLAVLTVGTFGTLVYFASKTVSDVVPSDNLEVVYGPEESSNTLLSIPVTGLILGNDGDLADPFGMLSESVVLGYDIKKQLYEAAEDEGIKGVILEINSPGGTIYGSDAIADGVAYYREKTKKPVVAFISGMGASGAYWVAASSDMIMADIGSIIGSIGVITGPFKYYDTVVAEDGGAFAGGVITQRGVETTFITAGKSKDLGNPYRRLTGDEIKALQTMVNNDYARFVDFVSKRRSLDTRTIRDEYGALIFDTETAITNRLIDKEGNREEAYASLAAASHIEGDDYKVMSKKEEGGVLKTLLQSRFGSVTSAPTLCNVTKVSLVYYGSAFELCP